MLKTLPLPAFRLRRLAAFALVATASSLRAADSAPDVDKTTSNAPVTVTDNGRSWTLDNGIVKATVEKGSGRMSALLYRGINTMGGGGYWEQTPQNYPKLTNTVTIDPTTNGGERAEVSVKGISGGRSFDMEFRYALARGTSGIYVYGIYTHPASYGRMGEGESRYIAKLNHSFNWLSVDSDRNLLECTPEDWGAGVVVHAKEQRILSTGYYKNTVEHKYSYNAVQYKIPAYGWSSTKDHVGVWFINPTTEYLGGGASKIELVAHYDANDNPDPIILDYWTLRRRRKLQHSRRRRVEQGRRTDPRLLQRPRDPQGRIARRPRHPRGHRRQSHGAARMDGQCHDAVQRRPRPG